MKKNRIFALTLCAAMALANGAAACEDGSARAAEDTAQALIGMANPWTDCASLAQAEQKLGFGVQAPDAVAGYPHREFRVLDQTLLEVLYRNPESGAELCIRKGVGNEDVSGDYTAYAAATDLQIGGRTVTLKGEEDRVKLAVWTDAGYSYAVSSSEGVTRDQMIGLVAGLCGAPQA